MDKKIERNIIWTLAIILILVGVFGCAKPNINADQPPKEKITITDSIANMGAIGQALGCMFGSSDPICDKPNTNEDTDKEWQEVDGE